MRFTVKGVWKVTGQTSTMSIEATDQEAAVENASRRGMDVRSVEKAASLGPTIGPTFEELEYARYVVSSRNSMGKILFGLVLAACGIGAAWYGYNIASNSQSTTHYTVYIALAAFGLYTAFKGAAANSSNEQHE